jgi:proteic killer suppression protein
MPTFRFHNLKGKLNGYFAIDVKTIRDKWRIILQPLDDEEKAFDPCDIDKIAAVVRIVEIREVSAHYE